MSGKVEPFADSLYALPTLSCDICHKHFNGRKPYNEHLKSNNHKKKLEKAALDVVSQESFKPKLKTCHSDGAYKGKEIKNTVDDYKYKKLVGNSETNKTNVFAGWNPVGSSISPTHLFPESNVKECEPFYVECAVCQLYFTSQDTAYMHFNSSEHKCKVAHHQEIEELYNSIKNIDIQEIVENLCDVPSLNPVENLCDMPSLNPLEKNVQSNFGNTAPTNSKQRILEVTESKLPPVDHMVKEKKLLPGCEICGIPSFPSVVSSLNHLSTTEHCRKAAMKSEAARLNSRITDESLLIPSSSVDTNWTSAANCYANLTLASPNIAPLISDYRTSTQEKVSSDGTALNPIGYERKIKQHQHSSYYPIEKSFCLPETNKDKASALSGYFSEVLVDPASQKYKTSVESDISLGGQNISKKYLPDVSQKCISKPFPRLAATFPQSNIHREQKNITGIEIVYPDADFSFEYH